MCRWRGDARYPSGRGPKDRNAPVGLGADTSDFGRGRRRPACGYGRARAVRAPRHREAGLRVGPPGASTPGRDRDQEPWRSPSVREGAGAADEHARAPASRKALAGFWSGLGSPLHGAGLLPGSDLPLGPAPESAERDAHTPAPRRPAGPERTRHLYISLASFLTF